MSTFDPFRDDDEDEQHTQFYPPPPAESTSGATRTLSPTEHARLMAGVRTPKPTVAESEPANRQPRPPGPPPLPALRREAEPAVALAPNPVGPDHAAVVVHVARCSAALLESLDALQAARGHLREAGLENADLAVVEQLLLGVLDAAHLRGWTP